MIEQTSSRDTSKETRVWQDLNWNNAYQTNIQMRYADIDTMGHLNNATYLQYVETARVQLLIDTKVKRSCERSVVARIEIDYLAEVKYGQDIRIETLVERLGHTSWTMLSRLLADNIPCAHIRTVEVQVNEEIRPIPLDPPLREALAKFAIQPTRKP